MYTAPPSPQTITIQLSTQDLFAAIAQLDTHELETFADQLTQLITQRKANPETELLTKIRRPLNPALHPQLTHLIQKRDNETLTPDEQKTLIQLTQQVEALNVERITHLSTLAQFRQTTLSQLIKDLGLKPIDYA